MKRLRPLRPGDPGALGGHQLLGRLGEGGMGVVYLGRSPGGTLAALKVVRAEYAEDPGFLARFRREAAATARLDNPWLVPVTASDTNVACPWLATPYIPGLSLAEAVAWYGPLPEPALRILARCLAEALTTVHDAGLVHRDVKPGNVLLTLDGPRLIDFGIVRPHGATVITETGLVIGSPGFLSPEQAQAHSGEVGPPSDVFSLGCLLAFAATGRLPFGAGPAASALYHTVHEEPDLDGVPAPLLDVVRSCLDKQPRLRPPAAQLAQRLTDVTATGTAAADPHTIGDWLPTPLLWTIIERSSEALTLTQPRREPDRDDSRPAPPTSATPPAPSSSETPAAHRTPPAPEAGRRTSRRAVLGISAVAATALGGTLSVLRPWTSRTASQTPSRPRRVIGLQADLTGEFRALGQAQEHGARIAVRDHNANDDRTFDLELMVRDDGGRTERAAATATEFAGTEQVVALLGPTIDRTLATTATRCAKAHLPLVTVSASHPDLTSAIARFPAYFQLRPSYGHLAAGFRSYLTSADCQRTAVIDDQAATDEKDQRIVASLRQLPPSNASTTTHTVPPDNDDFTAVAKAVRASRAQAVVYAGTSPLRAARCARALNRAGFEGIRMAGGPVLSPALAPGDKAARLPFVSEAGDAAEGWLFVTTYTDPTRLPAAEDFVSAYHKAYPAAPEPGPTAPFAVEAYDAVRFIASVLSGPSYGSSLRSLVATRLRTSRHQGLTSSWAFESETGLLVWDPGLYVYRITDGAPAYLGGWQSVEAPADRH